MPNESWRRDLRRENRSILGIIHNYRGEIRVSLGEDETSIGQAAVNDAPRKKRHRANCQFHLRPAHCCAAFGETHFPIHTYSTGYHLQLSFASTVLLARPVYWATALVGQIQVKAGTPFPMRFASSMIRNYSIQSHTLLDGPVQFLAEPDESHSPPTSRYAQYNRPAIRFRSRNHTSVVQTSSI